MRLQQGEEKIYGTSDEDCGNYKSHKMINLEATSMPEIHISAFVLERDI